jgi:hypothetical protein
MGDTLMTEKEQEATSPEAEGTEEKPDAKARKPFWTTLPGILTGLAAVVTAVGGLITVLLTAGILGPPPEATAQPSQSNVLRVVATTPENGATDVDPALTEIAIVFSEAVKQNSWSFVVVEGGEFPVVTGDPRFPEANTCALPVQLEAGKTYRVGVNSPTRKGFVSARDETKTAEPFVLVFSTR